MQSVPITTKVVSSNLAHGKVYSIQHYVIKFISNLWQVSDFLWFFFTNKTDCHDITEILLKVALNTINNKPVSDNKKKSFQNDNLLVSFIA